MEWIGELLGIGANVASGGIFGLVGSLLGVGTKYLQQRQANKQKDREWQHEIELRKLIMEAGDHETENELAIASSEGSWKGLSASYNTVIGSGNVHMWVNDFRSMFRPVLTVGLWVLVVIMLSWMLDGTLTAWITKSGIFSDTIKYIIDSAVFSASTATVWWFGDRAMTPPGAKAR